MDDELTRIGRAQAGDRQALGELLIPYQRPLLSFLLRMRKDRHAAEDLLQETFVRALGALGRFRVEPKPDGGPDAAADARGAAASDGGCPAFARWLFTIAANLARDARRGRRPWVGLSDEEADAATPAAEEETGFAGFEVGDIPDVRRRLEEAIAALPEAQREVLLLRVHSQMTFAEIARLVGCPLNTALGRMHYALARLRRALAPLGASVAEG